MKMLPVRLPATIAVRLAAVARKSGRSKSAVVRAILEKELARDDFGVPVSCLDLAAGLVGCVAGPHDLSVGWKHLKAYGA